MFLAELIDAPVLADGRHIGHVADVRLFLPRHTTGQRVGTPELFGLVVCPRRTGSFLGFERTDVRQPALLAAFYRWRARGSFLVLWDDLASVSQQGVELRPDAARWSPALT